MYNHLLDNKTAKYISHRVQKVFEAGLKEGALRYIDSRQIIGNNAYDKHSAIAECTSNVVFVPHPEFEPVDVGHYRTLLWLSLALFYFSLLLLLFEFYLKG